MPSTKPQPARCLTPSITSIFAMIPVCVIKSDSCLPMQACCILCCICCTFQVCGMPCTHHAKKRPADCRLCCPCPHSRIKRHCRQCTPCPHGKLAVNCIQCSGCVHHRVRRHCSHCRELGTSDKLPKPYCVMPDVIVVGQPRQQERASRASCVRQNVTDLQRRVLACRQGWQCAKCEVLLPAVFHVDHMTPLSQGGKHVIENLQVLCPNCHALKSSIENSRAQGCGLLDVV
jgi:hypothetical protein